MTNQHQLIKADTVYGLMQSTNDLLRDRFTSRGRTLDDNSWRTCNVYSLEEGFWKAITDRDFGSVLTYAVMLAGRDVNVASLIHNALESCGEQVLRIKGELHTALENETTLKDTIRLQGITNSQYEQTIKDLRAKLEEKGIDPDEAPNGGWVKNHYGPMHMGVATLESTPELCWSVDKVVDGLTEYTTIQGDPAAVKDLVLTLARMGREDTESVSIESAHNIPADSLSIYDGQTFINQSYITELVKEAASKGAAKACDDIQNIPMKGNDANAADKAV